MAFYTRIFFLLSFVAAIGCSIVNSSTNTADLKDLAPAPNLETPAAKDRQIAVFAGGCFWGVDAVFKHVRGVTSATAGYAGGSAGNAQYEIVSSGRTGHAESVKLTYDRSQITYGQLLKIFFSVAHDPTERDRQGPDEGT